jgi:hypothetical protein
MGNKFGDKWIDEESCSLPFSDPRHSIDPITGEIVYLKTDDVPSLKRILKNGDVEMRVKNRLSSLLKKHLSSAMTKTRTGDSDEASVRIFLGALELYTKLFSDYNPNLFLLESALYTLLQTKDVLDSTLLKELGVDCSENKDNGQSVLLYTNRHLLLVRLLSTFLS